METIRQAKSKLVVKRQQLEKTIKENKTELESVINQIEKINKIALSGFDKECSILEKYLINHGFRQNERSKVWSRKESSSQITIDACVVIEPMEFVAWINYSNVPACDIEFKKYVESPNVYLAEDMIRFLANHAFFRTIKVKIEKEFNNIPIGMPEFFKLITFEPEDYNITSGGRH